MVTDISGEWRPAPAASIPQYLTTDHGLRWQLGAGISSDSHTTGWVRADTARRFEPGRGYRIKLNGGVYGPVVSPASTFGGLRAGRYWELCVPMFADGAGDETGVDDTVRSRLTTGSTVVADLTDP
ncbi:hypothetical protein [Streptomyces sp. NPDC054940]